jgi:tetratricopeptide (TPR) repeat protein
VEIVLSNAKTKNIAAIDTLSFELTDGSGSLEDSELAARRDEVLEKLIPYTKKGGVAGVRANMLAAEIEYQKKNYESAVEYWENAADKDVKAYTSSLALFNAGVCYEALNQLEDAEETYKLAADDEEFLLRSHALFSYGRVLEANGKYKEAVEAYQELNSKYPDEGWANLAKTRIIELKLEGKAE